jgi:protein-S-isoprenylcysteine O-methyltransferase Ste14
VYRRTGINPFVLGNTDSAHDFLGRVFKLTVVVLLLDVLLFALWPGVYGAVEPIELLDHDFLKGTGVVLLLVSLFWIVLAQAQMGNAWRIGIDHERATELVDAGLFGLSRNPIFLGMRISLLGFFLALPDALTLVVLVLSEVLIQVQVRLEEEYLKSLHGEAYASYQGRVRRWI